jgi:formate hydrogenlyase transcriptional activator
MAAPLHPNSPLPEPDRPRQRYAQALRRFVRLAELEGRLARLEGLRDRQALVLHLNKLLLEHLDPDTMFVAISQVLREHLHHDFIGLSTLEADGSVERLRLLDLPGLGDTYKIGGTVPEFLPVSVRAVSTGRIDIMGPDRIAGMQPPELARQLKAEQIRSICHVPLWSRGHALGILSLGSRAADAFTAELQELLEQVAGLIALALDNALAFQDIRSSRDKLEGEKLYLEEEVAYTFATRELIGSSPSLMQVLEQIDTVAPSNATVLLLGETGTGKELLARAIHERSKRKERTFVRLNCSAIPLGLVESELFGHERGAFTGAIARKIGRFELAHQGTLFLDEIGDLPFELQPKLLRAIQEREFERLGSTQTLNVDVRLIAATHQDLARMVEQGGFRQDLFYRLNVFPIRVPSLRERKEDIPALVRYFTQKYAKAMDKRITRIPAEAMAVLVAWPWPGNIRELQNLVERSVILSPGAELCVPLGEMRGAPGGLRETAAAPSARTLEDLERDGILEALNAADWVVSNAAAQLGLKRTTLNSKMRKLGVQRTR